MIMCRTTKSKKNHKYVFIAYYECHYKYNTLKLSYFVTYKMKIEVS